MTDDFFKAPESGPLAKPARNARLVPLWIRLPLLFGALGLGAWWIISGTGVYLWIAELQAGIFDGEHYIVLSGLVAILVPLLPAAVVVQLLGGYYAKKQQLPPEP